MFRIMPVEPIQSEPIASSPIYVIPRRAHYSALVELLEGQ